MLFHPWCVHAVMLLWYITSLGSDSTSSPVTSPSDRLALLALKDQIKDPLGTLNSWNDSLHYCEWSGITCGHGHRDRVTVVDLDSKHLAGIISPHIGNLTFLATLVLTQNNLHGEIPQEIGHLFRLKFLNLSTNSFQGGIPSNISHCSDLRVIDLYDNNLSGRIPSDLTSLTKLEMLRLGKNSLYGSIPASFGNLSSLISLSLASNYLDGNLPYQLCRIHNLSLFSIGVNNFSGNVPNCIYNLSNIYAFAIHDNQFHGSLPSAVGQNLPKLESLVAGRNRFTGPIPISLSNASRLQQITLEGNAFTGPVPSDLGKLQGLLHLSFSSNQLGTSYGDDFHFITSLVNCSNLNSLEVYQNSLTGSLPSSIANLSTQITFLVLGGNPIYGNIPAGIGNLFNVETLGLLEAYLTGKIPKSIGLLSRMDKLLLTQNQLSGRIPESLGNLTQLSKLFLSKNQLDGNIPSSLGNCQHLILLDISNNRLNGKIPSQVIGISSLAILLDLSNNALSGSMPSEVGGLSMLSQMDLSGNQMSGHIPDALGSCLSLNGLSIAGNSFQGKIPQFMSRLKAMEHLDLSSNNFSGEIPDSLGKLTLLTYLNLSFNQLEGPIPSGKLFENLSIISVAGNSKLCGGTVGLKLHPCPIYKKKSNSLFLKVIVSVILVSLFLILLSCLLYYRRRKSKPKPPSISLLDTEYMRLSYSELVKATDNFSRDNLIGVGSYGSVYKGRLDEVDEIVAVKVLDLKQKGATKSFLSECNALRNIRHRNLLKIITACSSVDSKGNDFKALVFEFMPKGNLDEWLHPRDDGQQEITKLNFIQRLSISLDVAYALDYLHHLCQPTIIHCDLKPNNVLLDDDLTAHVADFGLAKVFSDTSSSFTQSHDSSLAIKGSIGYVAPEYGMGGEVSVRGDVYSYGILLLEMFIGKRPTDSIFHTGANLHNFAKMALPEKIIDIVDPTLQLKECLQVDDNGEQSSRQHIGEECLISLIKLGVVCSAESPMERLNMGEVITELLRIKDSLKLFHQSAQHHL